MAIFMNPTAQALAEAILYTECDERGVPLDRNYLPCNFDEKSLETLYNQFQQFIQQVEPQITEKLGDSWDCIDDFYNLIQPAQNQTEYDYILTRNRHGAGFWDGDWDDSVAVILTDAAQDQSEICAWVGDDGKIYLT
jgi:hypothetical protein